MRFTSGIPGRIFPTKRAGGGANLLSAGERERAARFRRDADRCRYLTAHAFLRRTIACYLSRPADALIFVEGPSGKPALKLRAREPDLRFSLAHSGEHALVALALGREVGVDIEVIQLDVNALALGREVFPEETLAALRSLSGEDRLRAFYRAWTRLEALLKACGAGFSLDPRRVPLPLDATSPLQVNFACGEAGPPGRWTVYDLELPAGLAGALAAGGSGWRPVYRQVGASSHEAI